tara:strand:+ start:2445 stop:3146 length:702 start_codon:yes stop_codon:yes gene_type:complete
LAPWLEHQGVSRNLQQYYVRSGWLEAIGRGAYARPGERVDWQSALEALQQQADLDVHVGGVTALTRRGYGHYLYLDKERIQLFSIAGVSLPAWFSKKDWGVKIEHIRTGFIPDRPDLKAIESTSRGLRQSVPERAIMECLYLAPKTMGLVECYQLMEGLANLRPHLVQVLLESCTSVKVKRLFLYLARKADHKWLSHVTLENVDLGKGDRSITPNGVFIKEFHISVPQELASL